jgi:hypothetical protein
MYTKENYNRNWYLLKEGKTIAIFDLEKDIDIIIEMYSLISEAEKLDILADTQSGVY